MPRRWAAVVVPAIAAAAVVATGPAHAATPQLTVVVGRHGQVHTLSAAQRLAARLSSRGDVTVELTPGTYRLARPLVFHHGARGGHTITWTSVPGEGAAILSGGRRITGWEMHDAAHNIWSAPVPRGSASRQLYIDGSAATRARIPLSRKAVEFTTSGLHLTDPALDYLAGLPDQDQIELESLGSFTDRYSPVRGISGDTVTMQQPAWDNNTWGYDTLPAPYNGGTMYLENSYAFLQPGQWYLDSAAGRLYYRAADNSPMSSHDVELPRLQSLIQISGSYAHPVRGLQFRGIQFSDTTWLQPSSSAGYADQQSGAHIVGAYQRPADALSSCQNGCPLFEATRNEWSQVPAAVQVAAARDIRFVGNNFTRLGEAGLGIGTDADANSSGIGLGTQQVRVDRNSFTELGGSAIEVGGIQPDAHHPRDPAMALHDIHVADNTIDSVAQDYKDSAAILSTYVDHAVISHNSVSDLPYDGIDIGWGWGINDPGGNEYYRAAGLYDYQPIYHTPTTARDDVVTGNLIHATKKVFYDGGSIYNLSASPGTVISRNYIYDNHTTFGVLLDQGTRYVTMRDNVLSGCGSWVYINADTGSVDTFHTMDNLVTHNWYDTGNAHAPDGPGYDNDVVDNTGVDHGSWPAAAAAVIADAGARPVR